MKMPGSRSATLQFTNLLSSLRAELRAAGFRSSGHRWTIESPETIGVLDFQRSSSSSRQSVRFTINLGVFSRPVARFLRSDSAHHAPRIEDCHWRQRIGLLLPQHSDHWWTISPECDLTALSEELRHVLREFAIPAVVSRLSAPALLNELQHGEISGVTKVDRMVYLIILARVLGRAALAAETSTTLANDAQGRPWQRTAEIHLRRIAEMTPERDPNSPAA
jgi:hypothetical protein